MKRADSSVRQRVLGPCLLVIVATMSIADSFAQTARFTIIDARDGLTSDVMDAYAEALGSKTSSPIVRSRVKVIASAKHGFDAGAVDVPDQVRNIETDVTLRMIQRSSAKPLLFRRAACLYQQWSSHAHRHQSARD